MSSNHSIIAKIVNSQANNQPILVWGYLGAITIAEVFTTLIEPRVGMILYLVLLLALLIHTALLDGTTVSRSLLSLSLAPLIRIVSLSLPLANLPIIYWYFLTSIPIFVTTGLLIQYLNLSRNQLALTFGNLPIQLLIGGIGIVLGYIENLILTPEPLIDELSIQQLLIPTFILLFSTGFFEELIFRGLLQYLFIQILGRWLGILYVATLFAILHIGYQSVIDVIFVFCVGLIFGWIVDKTNSLLGVTIAHGLTNIFLFLVFPFL